MKTMSRRDALAGTAGFYPDPAGSRARGASQYGGVGGDHRHGWPRAFDGAIFAKDGRARIAALCDIYPTRSTGPRPRSRAQPGARLQGLPDLLASPDIDAVLIATPVFLHPEHFEAAVKAHKHIYIEKPAGADVAGVLRLLRAAQQADPTKHIAFGLQNRYSPEYRTAEEIVRTGKLGELFLMECHFIKGGAATKPRNVPPEQRIRQWGAWRDMSGDFIVEQDCHGLDILNWFAKAHPVKAIGSGGRKLRAYGDNLDHLSVTYDIRAVCAACWWPRS